MAYELYKRTGARIETPILSIVPDGRIVVNAAAVRIFTAERITSVLLLWDATNHKLAMKAARKGDENSYAVSITASSHSGSLRAKSFLNFIGWKARNRERILATWNQKEQMFEAVLPLEHLESERVPSPKGR
jgi:hypothetical protein